MREDKKSPLSNTKSFLVAVDFRIRVNLPLHANGCNRALVLSRPADINSSFFLFLSAVSNLSRLQVKRSVIRKHSFFIV